MTLSEIYDAIMAVKATTERIEQNQKDEGERWRGRVRDLEDRVTELERRHTERCPAPSGVDG